MTLNRDELRVLIYGSAEDWERFLDKALGDIINTEDHDNKEE